MAVNLGRVLKHLFFPSWWLRRLLPPSSLSAISRAVREAERGHTGEIRFAVETALDWRRLWRGMTARDRAVEVFSQLRVWDTEENNGVLIYLLLADRDVEIVADRGVARRVAQEEWERICRDMEAAFRRGDFEDGIIAGVREVGTRLTWHYDGPDRHGDELPNRPAIIKR